MAKFTRDSFVGILKAITELPDRKYNKFVLFALDKNKAKLTTIYNEILEKEKLIRTEDYIKFDNERLNLIKKFADKDEAGNVITDKEGNFTVANDFVKDFGVEFDVLKRTYSTTVEAYEKESQAFKAFISEEIDVEFVKVSFNHIPEDLDGKQFSLFSLFVKETEEEITKLV